MRDKIDIREVFSEDEIKDLCSLALEESSRQCNANNIEEAKRWEFIKHKFYMMADTYYTENFPGLDEKELNPSYKKDFN